MSRSDPLGKVALIALGGELVPQLVTGLAGKRLVTRGLDGVERKLAEARVFWLSPKRLQQPDELERYWRTVCARADAADLAMAWELLEEAGELGTMTGEELADLTPGGQQPEDVDGAVLAVFRNGLHFKIRKGRVHATSSEGVDAALRRRDEETRKAAELGQVKRYVEARLEPTDEPLPEPDPGVWKRHRQRLVRLASAYGRELSASGPGAELLEALGRGSGDAARAAFELLVELGMFSPHENLAILRAGVRTRFPDAVVTQAEKLAAGPPDVGDQVVDLTHLLTVSIDDRDTTEIDDAFAVDGQRLYVFIADAAAFVPRGSALEHEAFRRGATLYVPTGKVLMLPSRISEDAASLVEGKTRPALCFSGVIDTSGELVDLRIEEALCRVDRRLTYDDVDEQLVELRGLEEDVATLVHTVQRWMELHQEMRARAGALTFVRKEVRVRVDDAHRVTLVPSDPNGPARQLVSEMMVALGAATAKHCRQRKIPCIYRSQPSPDEPSDHPTGFVTDPVERIALLRRLKPTSLTVTPKAHYTLGLDAYTQVTSPLRRYQDLLMHHQLKSVLRSGRPALADSDLIEAFEEVESHATSLRQVEQESRRYWTLWHLEERPDEPLSAVALRPIGKRWLVELPDFAQSTLLSPRGKIEAGQELELRIGEVDARRDKLVLYET